MLSPSQLPGRIVLAVFTLLWCAALSMGFGMLWNYASAPGPAGEPPSRWPASSGIPRANDKPTLLMFAHPKCPCTRASINELARIMADCRGRLEAHVLFDMPAGATSDWEQTELCTFAQSIPSVQVQTDHDQAEAERFAAKTSGFVLLYGTDGRLLFQGGITSSRGHSGDNLGRSAILDLLNTGSASTTSTSVFGCLLCNDSTCPSPGGESVTPGGEVSKHD
jgi:hypothetical protein